MANYPAPKPSNLMSVSKFSGINWAVNGSQIEDNEACIMENFCIIEGGKLSKRTGININLKPSGTGPINGITTFKNKLIFARGTNLYECADVNNSSNIKTITTGIANNKVNFFNINNILYILDGTMFFEYDGVTCTEVYKKAYVPMLFIVCDPKSGSGQPLEQWNLLGKEFKLSYSADGTSTIYKSCFPKGIQSIISVTVDNVLKVLTTDYTVDADGSVIFKTAPAKGTDNVVIHSLKKMTEEQLKFSDRINKSTIWSLYGGQNDTRILLSGQDSVFYRSAVYEPHYFPENHYQSVGDTEEKITGFVTQYDYCVILKEHSIWHTRFELMNDGTTAYITKPLNAQFGCINPSSVQLIENSPIFLDRNGLATINQTTVRDERNVNILSRRINESTEYGDSGLLDEINFHNGKTVDFNGMYIYAIGYKWFIYDYRNNCFYIWKFSYENNGIEATCFAELDNNLYFGTKDGVIYSLKKRNTIDSYIDEIIINGIETSKPIKSFWKSKIYDFGADERRKLVQNLYFSMNAAERTSVTIKYVTDKNETIEVGTTTNYLFNYSLLDYFRFSYVSTNFPLESNKKIKAKKVINFQLILESSEVNESLDIFGLDIKYKYMNYVK
ncbi:MAG: hypothetical protein RR851_13220 [Clostridium sp.]